MKKILLLYFLILAGCANQDFPFCCDPSGDKNVPYAPTYDFSVGTGFVDIGGNTSFLRIISQGDVANLFNAANVSQIPGTGSVGGVVFSNTGASVTNVILSATDRDGNQIGDLFYNSLGGIPDFSTTAGTDASGGFTLLNAPPGEVYLKAVQGGRGNTSLLSFPGAVSITKLSVIPVVQPVIGMTGAILEYDTGTTVPSALVSPVGLKGLDVIGTSGTYRFPLLGSDSTFLILASSPGYFPMYTEAKTDLSTLVSGAIDVTQNIFLISQGLMSSYLNQTQYLNLNNARGILAGATRDPDGTFRQFPHILLTDDQGNSLNVNPVTLKSRIYYHGFYFDSPTGTFIPAFYFSDPSGTKVTYFDLKGQPHTHDCSKDTQPDTCPPAAFGSLDGKYVAFDLPPGTVNLSVTALEKTEAGVSYYTGEESAQIFPGSVSQKDITLQQVALGKNNYYQSFAGRVTLPDGVTPVSFATLFALGNPASLTTADAYGLINIPLSSNIFLDQAQYRIKVSAPLYMDTYQNGKIDQTIKNLAVYPMTIINQYMSSAGFSSSPDPTRGILAGNIIDHFSNRATDGVSLQATDTNGNIVGDVRYFDSAGLPTLTQASSKNGGYIIFNLPPGLIQIQVISQDDSGNILVQAYPNGLTLADIQMNNSPPPAIQIAGKTRDLDGIPAAQVSLSVLGEKTRFSSDGAGNFSKPFPPFSQFTLKGLSPLSGGIDTYNLFQTELSDMNQLNLFAITTTALQTAAINAGVTLDLTQGFIGGKVTTNGFSTTSPVLGFPVSGFPPAPMTDIAQHKMVIGLFNRDNEIDMAMVNSADNTLTVLLGGGDGTFLPAPGTPLCMPRGTILTPGQTCSTNARPVVLRTADLNGDGFLDLIVGNSGTNSITILLGTQNGSFIPFGAPISLPAGSSPIGISIGDFNNDQKLDLVVLNSGTDTFSLILGNGDGSFQSPIYNYYSGGSSPSAILSGDFNGDGNLDVAIANKGSNSVSIFLGLGNGLFTPAPKSPIPVGSLPVAMVSSDLNGDGVEDLVTANLGSRSVSILLGKGGGLFKNDPCLQFPVPSYCSLNGAPQFIAVQDINSDGRPDLISSSGSGDISVLTGLGDGTFTAETRYFMGGNPSNLALADFNDDGFVDVIGFQASQGTLSFLKGSETALPNVRLAAADLNGNGVGQVRYYQNGIVVPATTSTLTDTSGKFLIFNVPPGYTNVHATQGGVGNRFMTSYAGSATFGNVPVTPPNYLKINLSGTTIDPVGNQVGRFVEGVAISNLGTGSTAKSDLATSTFSFSADANSFLFLKLTK